MEQIVIELNQLRGVIGPSDPNIFKTVSKHLIFAASKIELPVKGPLIKKLKRIREDISYDHVKLWAFWNPEQKKIFSSKSVGNIIITSSYSTGKTTCLVGRCKELSDSGEKVLFINIAKINMHPLRTNT